MTFRGACGAAAILMTASLVAGASPFAVGSERQARPLPGNRGPRYPEAAKKLLVAGEATFRVKVVADGTVEDVLVLAVPREGLGFEAALREAVLDWKFEPLAEPAYYLGRHAFSLRLEDEARIRELAGSMRGDAFHPAASVVTEDGVYRKSSGPWLSDEALARLGAPVRSIDFAAGDAATVALDGGALLRVLRDERGWRIVSFEPHPHDVQLPEKVEDVLPVFPLDAVDARPEQLVVLQALVDHEGAVRHLDVVSSVPELDEAAVAAARQWRFRPATRAGVAIPYVMTLTVGFAGEAP